MKKLSLILITVLIAISLSAVEKQTPLVINNVTVIDTANGITLPDMKVVIGGNKIIALEKSGKSGIPADATLIEAKGKYLIPGLWDMHTHAFMVKGLYESMLPQFIACGVIGIRDMDGVLEELQQARKEIDEGKFIGPHLYFAGKVIDGPKPVSPASPSAKTVDDARRLVRERKKQNVDFIKVYSRLTREQFFAIADEAKKFGLSFVGHVPFEVRAAEASQAGMRSFEHLLSVETGVSTKEDELRQIQIGSEMFKWPDATTIHQTYSKQKADELFTTFVKNDTWQVPTLVTTVGVMNRSECPKTDDPRINYMPPFIKEMWEMEMPPFGREFQVNMKVLYPFYAKLVKDMQQAGVGIMAGTDTPFPTVFPGISLHEELELLVKAGLTPMESLQAATIQPARFLGIMSSHGSIEKGKVADLVLLNANPLDDISNTQKIEAVVLGGKYLSQAQIEELWKQAEAASAPNKSTL